MFEVFVLHLSFQISDPGDYCRRSLTLLHETTLVDPVHEIAQSVQFVQPAVNAQTRLQGRTLDSKLDRLMSNLIKRKSIFSLEHIISTRGQPIHTEKSMSLDREEQYFKKKKNKNML
ncbi:hypothetical protein SAY87_008098 [Trapa incisa]|uniref:Uncharacterized protein n=1 Tax=Trapa incisa TaxID=236973 RepID=A0AAN7QFN7_9MYRT|nr:hypothetical protein SAY87_008098 [Trapa incisa]